MQINWALVKKFYQMFLKKKNGGSFLKTQNKQLSYNKIQPWSISLLDILASWYIFNALLLLF